jgi:Cu/Ag efflux protein CusF/cytochrome c5
VKKPSRRSGVRGPAVGAAMTLSVLTWCALSPQPASSHAQATTTVQFDREIVRILDNHCVMCHMQKGPAFPLVTYEQTYAARWKIRQDVLDRHMAPWAAMPGYGDFANDNGLTQREIDFFVAWAESYGPRNNGEVYTARTVPRASTSKPVQARVDFERWELGKPDLLVTIAANTVEPRQTEQIKRVMVDPKLKSARWLRGLEYKPGDRRVVRAVSFSIQESGQWLGSWTPWQGFASLPEKLAIELPAGSHIVAEIHYYGGKEPVVDQGSLGLYYSGQSSQRVVSPLVIQAKPADSRRLIGTVKLSGDTNILALEPELRAGVQSIEVAAKAPGGMRQVLLFARDIPIEWPTPYVYRRPVSLPKGTELSVIEHYSGDTSIPSSVPVTFSVYEGAALPAAQPTAPAPPLSTRRFELTGTVKSVDADTGRLVVQHGEIPGFMGAMTMSYSVSPPSGMKNISPGDQIHSDVVVSDTGSHLENVQVTRRGQP